jgi:hypothetical protein
MKKILIISVIIFASSIIFGRTVQAVYTPMAGDLIKTDKSSAVYIVDDYFKRHLFPNEATFWTWYTGGWSSQKVNRITQDEFDELGVGKNVIARPGTNLIRFDNSNKVFAVTPGGVLCESRSLYGNNWESRVIKIQSSFETDYIKDNSCIIVSNSKLPDGSLIQYVNSKDIYYIEDGKKRKITADGFTKNDFRTSSIISDVPVAMAYTANSKTISVFEYDLGILHALADTSGQVVATRPDLIISDIIFPLGQVKVNESIEIKLVIKNIGGNLISSSGLSNIVFTGADWNATSISMPSYPNTASPLQTGQTFEITYFGKFAASGSKSFTVKVDEPSQVLETNEKNNTYSESITVYSN